MVFMTHLISHCINANFGKFNFLVATIDLLSFYSSSKMVDCTMLESIDENKNTAITNKNQIQTNNNCITKHKQNTRIKKKKDELRRLDGQLDLIKKIDIMLFRPYTIFFDNKNAKIFVLNLNIFEY